MTAIQSGNFPAKFFVALGFANTEVQYSSTQNMKLGHGGEKGKRKRNPFQRASRSQSQDSFGYRHRLENLQVTTRTSVTPFGRPLNVPARILPRLAYSLLDWLADENDRSVVVRRFVRIDLLSQK